MADKLSGFVITPYKRKLRSWSDDPHTINATDLSKIKELSRGVN